MLFTAVAATTEFAKRWNPQPGDIVSFKHHGYLLASKKPKLPTLYRIRSEMKWEDVVSSWKEQKLTPSGTTNTTTLHSLPLAASPLCLPFSLSFSHCLIEALPMRRPQSKNKPKGFWKDVSNRRKFFIDLAKEIGFNHLDAEGWHRVTHAQIFKKKGAGLLGLYSNSLKIALEQTFPDINYQGS